LTHPSRIHQLDVIFNVGIILRLVLLFLIILLVEVDVIWLMRIPVFSSNIPIFVVGLESSLESKNQIVLCSWPWQQPRESREEEDDNDSCKVQPSGF
jgi:hypothetical protein